MTSRSSHPGPALRIDAAAGLPKYRQIVQQIGEAIDAGHLHRGDMLPSINELSTLHGLARDTVVKAYNTLKQMGLIESRHGKAFHVATDHYRRVLRVFVLFDNLTPYKETLYEAMRAEAAGRMELDVYFHHFRPEVFVRLLADARGRYAHYVVMPFMDDAVRNALSKIEQNQLLLLDIDVDYPGKNCAGIYQCHDRQLEKALEETMPRLNRYERFVLVFPEEKHHPLTIPPAFRRFCRRHGLRHKIVSTLTGHPIHTHEAYFVIEDADLVELVKAGRQRGFKLGRDLGILSYNEEPMKEVVQQGVTVVSVDFAAMGRKAVRRLLGEESEAVQLEPTRLIARHSL